MPRSRQRAVKETRGWMMAHLEEGVIALGGDPHTPEPWPEYEKAKRKAAKAWRRLSLIEQRASGDVELWVMRRACDIMREHEAAERAAEPITPDRDAFGRPAAGAERPAPARNRPKAPEGTRSPSVGRYGSARIDPRLYDEDD